MPRDISRITSREAELNAAVFEPPAPIERVRSMRLKTRIESYWRERAYSVDVIIADDGAVQSNIVQRAPV